MALVYGLADARSDVVAAPALAYGSSGEHAGFDGTLSIGDEAVELLLVELVRSATETFSRVLLVCAHGGNEAPLRRAEKRLRSEGREVRAWLPRWSGDAHAGRLETSLILAIAPGRVVLGRAAAGERAPLEELMPRLMVDGVRAVTSNGVHGDPAGASPAEGGACSPRRSRAWPTPWTSGAPIASAKQRCYSPNGWSIPHASRYARWAPAD